MAIVTGDASNNHIHRAGDDRVASAGSGQNDITGVTTENDFIYGLAGDDVIYGDAGDDSLFVGLGDDILIGGSYLVGNAGFDAIDGGDGMDTANFYSSRKFFTATENSDGSVTISIPSDGTDTLYNVESYRFITDLGGGLFTNELYTKAELLDTNPPVEPQSTLPVTTGGLATISTAFLLSYDDVSGPAGVTYEITQAPLHGTLLRDGIATSTFTQDDIDAGLVQYRQDGDVSTADGFMFTVFDKAGNWIGPEPFTIAILDTTDPVVFENNAATVSADGGLLIWKDALSTVALGSDPAEMVYTVLATPAHGALVINGQPVSSFMQADIDNGLLSYVQPGGGAESDGFSFVVTDETGKQTAPQTFHILTEDGTVAMTAANDPATFGLSDITIPAISSDISTGWSDDSVTMEISYAILADYLELNQRGDDTGDAGGNY
jgi:hypothetical protein